MTKSTLFNEVVGCKANLKNTNEDENQRNLVLSKKAYNTQYHSSNQHHSNSFTPTNNPYQYQLKLKQALIDHLVSDGFDLAITLTFNNKTSHSNARKKLSIWTGRLNKKLYGPRWRTRNNSVFFYAFPEKFDTNYHFHILLRVEKDLRLKVYNHSPIIWKKLVRSSTCHLKPLLSDGEQSAWVLYVTKELWNRLHYEYFIVSTEFKDDIK